MELNSLYQYAAIFFGFVMAWGIGANDVSNAIGTSVGSKAITIRQAIIIAIIFESLGAFLVGGEVTNTIKDSILYMPAGEHSTDILCIGMLASLMSSGCWLLLASFLGWPVSTTHTIVGAIIGFGVAQLGIDSVQWPTVFYILLGWLGSPFIGAAISYTLFTSTRKLIFEKKDPVIAARNVVPFYVLCCSTIVLMITIDKIEHLGVHYNLIQSFCIAVVLSIPMAVFSRIWINKLSIKKVTNIRQQYAIVEKIFAILMVLTACAMAFAHGSNDVSNAIGPLSAIISAINPNVDEVPLWVLTTGALGIVVGLATYGHKVIATVGTKITQLTPSRGFSATLAAAITVLLASSTGLPISTTHTLVGGILGIGLARGVHALNLNVIKTIFASWIVTFPAGAILSVIFYHILYYLIGNFFVIS